MSETARAFWVVEPGRGDIIDEILPERGADDIRVRTLFSGISRGTEALVFKGEVPASEWTRMRAPFQHGDFPAPVKYGYVNVGLVEGGPPALVGQTVFVLFPHQTRFIVPATAAHVVPAEVPPARAVLAANLETAINGLWDARPHVGDRITVIGGGTVGCLVAWLAARMPGCDVELVDVDPARADTAAALGVRFATPETAQTDPDVVIHTSGAPSGLTLALQIAAVEATIVEMSWYGAQPVTLDLGAAFHSRRLRITSSQVGMIAPTQRGRWDFHRRMALALSLLTDPALDVLISGESPFESLPSTMARLAHTPGALCHRVVYA